MTPKKRTKRSRYRGTHTHGRGAKKKARGKGHRGGVGMAGTGKRGDAKKTLITKEYGNDYFGTTIRVAGRDTRKVEGVDLRKIVDRLDNLSKKGISKKTKDEWDLDLTGKKVLCTGELKVKLNIKAKSASKGAIEKIKKSGGKIELTDDVEIKDLKEEKSE